MTDTRRDDRLSREMERIINAPWGYVFRAGSTQLRDEARLRDALDYADRLAARYDYSVLMETPILGVYLEVQGPDTGYDDEPDFEFCTVEGGRLVGYLPCMHLPEETCVLIRFCDLTVERLVRGVMPPHFRPIRSRVDVFHVKAIAQAWLRARQRLTAHVPSRLTPSEPYGGRPAIGDAWH